MDRRSFLRAGGATALGAVLGGCAKRAPATSPVRVSPLYPVDITWDRVIRTTVGLRPFRESGFFVGAEPFDEHTVIHNYGHGGAGMSLAWGTAHHAADFAVRHPSRDVAIIGCGVAGLTTARVLQRRGFDVSMYATSLPPDTTSNLSWGGFTPWSGIVAQSRRTPEWDARFRRAAEIAYSELQLLAGRHYGVTWIDEYAPANSAAMPASRGGGDNAMLPPGFEPGRILLQPGEHPFSTRYARRRPTLRIEPAAYLDALMRDVIAFGGRIHVRTFESVHELMTLPQRLLINCTGLGAKKLFGDDELIPVRGQLVVLVPQHEVAYSVGAMMPRSDGIVLGHTMERGVWSLDVNEAERQRVMDTHMRLFHGMRPPRLLPAAATASAAVPDSPPPLDSFADRVS